MAGRGTAKPKDPLAVIVKRLGTIAKRIDALLNEGKEFRHMDAAGLQRLDRELDEIQETVRKLRDQIPAQEAN